MRSLGCARIQYVCCPSKRKVPCKDRHIGTLLCDDGAGGNVAAASQEPRATRSWKRPGRILFSRLGKRAQPCQHLDQTSVYGTLRICVSAVFQYQVWTFVTETLRNRQPKQSPPPRPPSSSASTILNLFSKFQDSLFELTSLTFTEYLPLNMDGKTRVGSSQCSLATLCIF